ncbi:anti-virulence regulator CigR family protein [Halomonas sp. HK25]|uniref:anti-virulence regulator CigR family protein n=1 Tax=Halomonas sp. HK25 TaxID=3394321 RepID=UPI0039FCD7A3
MRRLFGERRDWVREDERAGLPPGIRMNLERGKPLPPGIAKRFDERSLGHLPRYDGYEWRRVGPDAILVDAANEIIYQVIRDVLY